MPSYYVKLWFVATSWDAKSEDIRHIKMLQFWCKVDLQSEMLGGGDRDWAGQQAAAGTGPGLN